MWFFILFSIGLVCCFTSVSFVYLYKKDGISNTKIFLKGSSVYGNLDDLVYPPRIIWIKALAIIGVLLILISLFFIFSIQ